METLDLLQEVIADYDGTVLIVSHDRDFLDRTVTVTLGLDGSGTIDVVSRGYEDCERKSTSRETKKAPPQDAPAAPPHPPQATKPSSTHQRYYTPLPNRHRHLTARTPHTETAHGQPDLQSPNPQ